MKISDLPPEYQELAKKRRREQETGYYRKDSNNLNSAFHWASTAEGQQFWEDCDKADKIVQLPSIPKNEDTRSLFPLNKKQERKLLLI